VAEIREPHEILAENIRALAKKRRMALSHLADLSGVGQTQMWAVLRGATSPTVSWLDKLADVLEVQVHDLLRPRPARKR
jgi:transcriptional regulator with XRE-family HTH domain